MTFINGSGKTDYCLCKALIVHLFGLRCGTPGLLSARRDLLRDLRARAACPLPRRHSLLHRRRGRADGRVRDPLHGPDHDRAFDLGEGSILRGGTGPRRGDQPRLRRAVPGRRGVRARFRASRRRIHIPGASWPPVRTAFWPSQKPCISTTTISAV